MGPKKRVNNNAEEKMEKRPAKRSVSKNKIQDEEQKYEKNDKAQQQNNKINEDILLKGYQSKQGEKQNIIQEPIKPNFSILQEKNNEQLKQYQGISEQIQNQQAENIKQNKMLLDQLKRLKDDQAKVNGKLQKQDKQEIQKLENQLKECKKQTRETIFNLENILNLFEKLTNMTIKQTSAQKMLEEESKHNESILNTFGNSIFYECTMIGRKNPEYQCKFFLQNLNDNLWKYIPQNINIPEQLLKETNSQNQQNNNQLSQQENQSQLSDENNDQNDLSFFYYELEFSDNDLPGFFDSMYKAINQQ